MPMLAIKQLKGLLMKPHVIIEAPSQMEYLRVALVIFGALATGWVLRGLVIC